VEGAVSELQPSQVRLRVDELAGRAGVSVDTIRFYQRERLLPPPERVGRVAYYDASHVERLGRIRAWQRIGYPLALIRRVLSGEVVDDGVAPLAEAVWRATPTAPARTAVELSREAGVPEVFVERMLADGLLMGDADDVPVLQAGARLVALGIPVTELLDLARAHHAATREMAEQAVQLFDRHVRRPARRGAGPDTLVQAFETALAAVHDLVGGHFRRVLLAVAAEHLQRALEPGTGDAGAADTGTPDAGSAAEGPP
jgi:DNA-binding transcriptional MerR regulator